MDKINVFDLEGNERESVKIPSVFNIKPRKDIIIQAFESSQSHGIQSQGRDKRAGLRNTAEGWGTGHGMSRAPRIKGSGFPTARNVGRVPFAKGGRRSHPIKKSKNTSKKINKGMNRLSILNAISASGRIEWVRERGHIIESVPNIPLVVDDKIQTIKKTSRIYSILCELGLKEELEKVKNGKKRRSGKGKRRGRKYKKSKGLLIVIKEDFGIVKAARNIPGLNIIQINDISINELAPGGHSGRLILWTQSAFNELNSINEEM
ncbi:MAG: 50S ribosomal protein L4 [Candidatus Lokiarchaeota archaeon]|nr:50S ribosomal protein L4 [Candidatus Lokiarchaeota archaeon]MBD3198589.1 50S ribosomal protein L4 [Candidatus Lokiarchaeota archaeon]